MYKIKYKKGFKKSLKKLLKSGKKSDIQKLKEVIDVLASGKSLLAKHKNHYLSGHMSEFQECHVKSDLLLIYFKNDDVLVLVLMNIGSHSDLFE